VALMLALAALTTDRWTVTAAAAAV